jgi:hypothetical protein
MEDLYRRLLRIILILAGSYFSLTFGIKQQSDINQGNFIKVVLLITLVYMIVDNYIPRVHIYQSNTFDI